MPYLADVLNKKLVSGSDTVDSERGEVVGPSPGLWRLDFSFLKSLTAHFPLTEQSSPQRGNKIKNEQQCTEKVARANDLRC